MKLSTGKFKHIGVKNVLTNWGSDYQSAITHIARKTINKEDVRGGLISIVKQFHVYRGTVSKHIKKEIVRLRAEETAAHLKPSPPNGVGVSHLN